ncbi:MAG: EAL domain-containing protein [Holosporaceae bacterium]|jgi:EAL domain-containing protein (putative c-di-GMP-specific phosphodiesterase class I)|nr:EAL domain-containing protein [Holosporaceae bacterium]
MVDRIRLQPLIRLDDGTVFGYEALYRKEDASGYPSAVDVLESVAASCGYKEGFQLFINMTVNDIVNPGFCRIFTKVLERWGVRGSNVVLEVSEKTHPDYLPLAQRTLSLLRRHDIKIALDDFGTEYSSLSFLKELPLDIVKIDKRFVQEAPSSKKSRALLRSCACICHDVRCDVIAEGIETEEQLDCVKNSGADIGQGFLFSATIHNFRRNPFIPLRDFSSLDMMYTKKAHVHLPVGI